LLGIRKEDIRRFGLTSEEIAREMASGALRASQARLAISNIGVAGPDDASDGTKSGTVYFAWIYLTEEQYIIRTATSRFSGDRAAKGAAKAAQGARRRISCDLSGAR